jgi:hypothetical protein
MSINKFKPHVLVIPEDDANRQIANGFLLDPDIANRSIQVLEEVGGWTAVRDRFIQDHIANMQQYDDRFVVLLVDFDERAQRLIDVTAEIPPDLRERVFVLGVWNEPENLKRALGRPYEELGRLMAEDCKDESQFIWGHPLLEHNAEELARLRERVRPILFPGNNAVQGYPAL